MVTSLKTHTTSDVSLAAFLYMRGMILISCKKKGSKFEFVFEDTQNQASGFEQEYLFSEFPRYDAAVRQMKSKLHSSNPA